MAKHFIRLMLQVKPMNRWELSLLLNHGWMRDPYTNRRLEMAIEAHYGPNYDDDTLTEDMENVDINENFSANNHSKRPRLG